MLRKLVSLLLLPLALIVIGVIRFISRWCMVRFGIFWSPRLGHMIGNSECYLCERDSGLQPKALDLWIPASGPRANRVVERKYRKILHVMPRRVGTLCFQVNALFHGWEKHAIQTIQVDRDVKGLWEKHAPHVGFTEREHSKGLRLLTALGIPPGASWVCLIVRDPSYLRAKFPGADFSYHDYRDADVSNYIPAAVELARRGYYVVRVGDGAAKPFHVKHTRIIDYAHGKRTPFGDLYLGAKCAFCLGTPTGFMAIAQTFNHPLCITDMVPLEYAPTWSRGLMIFKHHQKDGKRMSVREICDAGLGTATFAHLFRHAGVTLQDNTPEEIFALAMEMADHVETGSFDGEAQGAFWSNFPTSMVNGAPLNENIRLRIGREFLKDYS